MKLIHALPLLTYISFQSVHLLYSDLQEYSMTIIGCFYFSLCIHLVHSTFFYVTLCELSLNILTLNI